MPAQYIKEATAAAAPDPLTKIISVLKSATGSKPSAAKGQPSKFRLTSA